MLVSILYETSSWLCRSPFFICGFSYHGMDGRVEGEKLSGWQFRIPLNPGTTTFADVKQEVAVQASYQQHLVLPPAKAVR